MPTTPKNPHESDDDAAERSAVLVHSQDQGTVNSDQKTITFLSFAPELLMQFFQYLPPSDLVALMKTCRTLRPIASDNALWRPLFKRVFGAFFALHTRRRMPGYVLHRFKLAFNVLCQHVVSQPLALLIMHLKSNNRPRLENWQFGESVDRRYFCDHTLEDGINPVIYAMGYPEVLAALYPTIHPSTTDRAGLVKSRLLRAIRTHQLDLAIDILTNPSNLSRAQLMEIFNEVRMYGLPELFPILVGLCGRNTILRLLSTFADSPLYKILRARGGPSQSENDALYAALHNPAQGGSVSLRTLCEIQIVTRQTTALEENLARITGTFSPETAAPEKASLINEFLRSASIVGFNDIVRLLLPQLPMIEGETSLLLEALTYAAQNGHTDVVETLLTYTSPKQTMTYTFHTFVNHQVRFRVRYIREDALNSALYHAVYHGQTKVVKQLLDAGANCSLPQINVPRNCTALDIAITAGDAETAACLIDHGADPQRFYEREKQKNPKIPKLFTIPEPKSFCHALTFSVFCKNPNMVRVLLNAKCDPNMHDLQGQTALTTAVLYFHSDPEAFLEIADILLSGGAKIGTPNDKDETALVMAKHLAGSKNPPEVLYHELITLLVRAQKQEQEAKSSVLQLSGSPAENHTAQYQMKL